MTGEKKRVVVPAVDLSTLDARIAALKQYTVYPWAIDRVQTLPRRCTWLTIGENGGGESEG